MTETITAMDANPARIAGITPGRRTISLSGAAGCGLRASSRGDQLGDALRVGPDEQHEGERDEEHAGAQPGSVSARPRASRPEKIGPKTAGPRIAPKTAPNST